MVKQRHISKKHFMNFMEGHRKADAVIKKERIARLRRLTVDESFREYEALCDTWMHFSSQPLSDAAEKQRIAFLIGRRERLNKAGRGTL
jgi:hypothetical protein